MSKNRYKSWAHLSLLSANIFIGINYSVAKAVMPVHIKPLALLIFRSVFGTLLFWIASLLLPAEKVNRKDLLYLFGCSFFGVVINQTLFMLGLNLSSPINSSIILATNPIYAFVFAAIILNERITLLKGSGLVMGLTGVLFLILKNGTPDLSNSTFRGDVFNLVNSVSWAFYTVIIKRMLEKYHPVTVMKWTYFFGMFTIIPVGYNQWSMMDWHNVALSTWLAVGYVVVFATFLGYLLIAYGLRHLSPTIVSIYIYVQPVVAAYIATLIGQGNIDIVMVISAILIFAGVFAVSRQKNNNLKPASSG